jgi:exopolyphosphatase/pppGpp-phosphohydrolase
VNTAIDYASRVLDIGRTLDVVNRHQHVADILLSTELTGFTHAELALMSSIVRRAGDRHAEVLTLALSGNTVTIEHVDRAAVILALADEIEARCPQGKPIAIKSAIGRHVTVSVPLLRSWLAKDVDKRFEGAFRRPLVVTH